MGCSTFLSSSLFLSFFFEDYKRNHEYNQDRDRVSRTLQLYFWWLWIFLEYRRWGTFITTFPLLKAIVWCVGISSLQFVDSSQHIPTSSRHFWVYYFQRDRFLLNVTLVCISNRGTGPSISKWPPQNNIIMQYFKKRLKCKWRILNILDFVSHHVPCSWLSADIKWILEE